MESNSLSPVVMCIVRPVVGLFHPTNVSDFFSFLFAAALQGDKLPILKCLVCFKSDDWFIIFFKTLVIFTMNSPNMHLV